MSTTEDLTFTREIPNAQLAEMLVEQGTKPLLLALAAIYTEMVAATVLKDGFPFSEYHQPVLVLSIVARRVES